MDTRMYADGVTTKWSTIPMTGEMCVLSMDILLLKLARNQGEGKHTHPAVLFQKAKEIGSMAKLR
jgi:hypothetical protein